MKKRKDKIKKARKNVDRFKLFDDFLNSGRLADLAPMSMYKNVKSCGESLRLGLKKYGISNIKIHQTKDYVLLIRTSV